MMNGLEKSDLAVVAMKPANKTGQPVAEWVEPRAGTEGNTGQPRTHRAQNRASVSPGLERVRLAARLRKKEKFTALLHHVTVDLLQDDEWLVIVGDLGLGNHQEAMQWIRRIPGRKVLVLGNHDLRRDGQCLYLSELALGACRT